MNCLQTTVCLCLLSAVFACRGESVSPIDDHEHGSDHTHSSESEIPEGAEGSVHATASTDALVHQRYTVTFDVMVGDLPWACGVSYSGIGLSGSTLDALDFKMSVHGVRLIRSSGEEVPLQLEQDSVFQKGEVALLDFENGQGLCDTNSPELHTTLTGEAPSYSDYEGVVFAIGLPKELNFLDPVKAESPLTIPGMWWSWKGGYKYLRLDVKTRKNKEYYFHLGASGCNGTTPSDVYCDFENVPEIRLMNMKPTSDVFHVTADLAKLWSGSDLDQEVDRVTDFVPGCMSSPEDPECGPVFHQLGLSMGSQQEMNHHSSVQSVFLGQ